MINKFGIFIIILIKFTYLIKASIDYQNNLVKVIIYINNQFFICLFSSNFQYE